MTSNKTITPLIGGNYYHIYNRGINRQNIFFTIQNYNYFMALWKKYLDNCSVVLAYSLLPNHFHFLLKINEKIEVEIKPDENRIIEDEIETGKFVSERLRRLFISYSQALNIQENRTGSLFSRNFKRIEITDDTHLNYLIFYIHYNAQKHGIAQDFRTYRYSSYKAYISSKPTNVAVRQGLEFFDGLEGFLAFHNYFHEVKEDLIFE